MHPRLSRREILALGGTAMLAATAVPPAIDAQRGRLVPPKFRVALPIPGVLSPVRRDATTDYYEIVQRQAQIEIVPGLRTTIWGYDGRFPGPTIEAQRGRRTVIRQTNRLDVHTVVHLHGGVTPADSDGFPTDMILPGRSRTYTYPNEGPAATLWYHDHAMDTTGRNLYMGLAGVYIVRDDAELGLNLPKGPHDVPLVLQDRVFDANGAFVYDTFHQLAAKGGTMLVNGAAWPRFEVATRKYRFRIVNASNATPVRLALGSGRPLVLIASEGGLLPKPIAVPSIPLAMAERVEVVIDFSHEPVGSTVVLRNLNEGNISGLVSPDIMRFDVTRREVDDSSLPDRLGADIEPIPTAGASTREFVFAGRPALALPPRTVWRINGQDFDIGRAIATPRYGDVEVWHVTNRRFLGLIGLVHPVHVHLVHFQVIERNGGPPLPHETGWKDTVSVDSGEDVRIAMRFSGYRGRYVVHCHNLEHEDHSMMARFDVV